MGEIVVAACCRIVEHEEARLVRTSDGVWHLLRWGPNPTDRKGVVILDQSPVHHCPLCGAPLDSYALGQLVTIMEKLGHPMREEANKLLAPVQLYMGGHGHINARLTDLGEPLPDPARPFVVEEEAQPGAAVAHTDAQPGAAVAHSDEEEGNGDTAVVRGGDAARG